MKKSIDVQLSEHLKKHVTQQRRITIKEDGEKKKFILVKFKKQVFTENQ